MLHGRDQEKSVIDQLLEQSRANGSSSLVVRGEAGIGKTSLLHYAQQQATDFQVLRCIGVESEHQWAFSGLHMMLRPVIKHIESLTLPQMPALRAAMGLNPEHAVDHFQVGVAVLNLLAELAEHQPLLCIIDDAQWLDQETQDALLFAARRFNAEPIALLLAARDGHGPHFAAPDLPELYVGPINEPAGRSLLAEVSQFSDESVIAQLLEESQGNPLALQELSMAHREGRAENTTYPAKARSTANRLRLSFAERILALPSATQNVLLLAAADRSEDMGPVLTAAKATGATVADLAPAEKAGLLRQVDNHIVFSHPLIRTAAYWDVPLHRRIDAHRSLAEVPGLPMCDRAFHLACAATGPDVELAELFTQLAEHEGKRGSHNNEALMYQRAAKFTADVHDRSRHLLAASEAALLAGHMEKAIDHVEVAEPNLTSDSHLGRSHEVRAKAKDWSGDPQAAHEYWMKAAAHRDAAGESSAGYSAFRAVEAAWMAGDLASAEQAAQYAEDRNLPTARWVRLMATTTAGMNLCNGLKPADAVRAMHELIAVQDNRCGPINLEVWSMQTWLLLLCNDLDRAHASATALADECRKRVGLAVLPQALHSQARVEVYLGRFADATAHIREAQKLQADMGQTPIFAHSATWVQGFIAAVQGDEDRCREYFVGHDSLFALNWLESFLAMIDISYGRYTEADQRMQHLADQNLPMETMALVPDMIEASVRVGEPDRYLEIFGWYSDYCVASGQSASLALVERCQALLSRETETEDHFARAVKLHRADADMPFERARTDLLYGEWLRRQRRNSDARPRLRAALETYERMGAQSWSARAAAELRAAGESTNQREQPGGTQQRLTAQELQVTLLAGDGLTNREIGQQLFLSPRTVGYHLYKAYPKLGVKSRSELAKLELGCYAISSCSQF